MLHTRNQWRTQKISEGHESIGVARRSQRDHALKFLENIVILCFERRFSKQNSVIHLNLNILVYTAEYWQYTVYTAEYCLYTLLFLGSEGGGWHSGPPSVRQCS